MKFVLVFFIQVCLFFSSANAKSVFANNNQIINQNTDFSLDFRLVDQFGDPFSLSDFRSYEKIFIISFHPSCHSRRLLDKVKKLKKENSKSVFLLLNSDVGISRENLIDNFPKNSILMDDFQQVSKSFNFIHSGDYVVLNSNLDRTLSSGNLLGKINLSNEDKLFCSIQFNQYAKGTFTNEVLPALEKTCLRCHSVGTSYDYFKDLITAKAWREMMLRTIRLKRMPPAADPYYSNTVDQYTNSDILKVSNWLASGAEFSEEEDKHYSKLINSIKERMKDNRSKVKSEVINLLSFSDDTISATGSDFKKMYTTTSPTKDDYYFSHLKLTVNTNVAHHIALHFGPTPIDPSPSLKNLYGNNKGMAFGKSNYGKLESYAFSDPNMIQINRQNTIQKIQANTIYHIPKGSYLGLEVHYFPTGREEVSPVKLQIANNEDLKESSLLKRLSMKPKENSLICKPFQKNVISVEYKLKESIEILSYGVHTHLRGRSSKLYYQLPGSKERKLAFSYPTIQYKMRTSINLHDALLLPKDTILISEIVYDNTVFNESNPNPSKTVFLGGSIFDEEEYLPKIYYKEKIN